MASTRNKNTRSDYCLEQNYYQNQKKYNLYLNSQYGVPFHPAFSNAGFAPPSRVWRDQLSHNPVEIESALLGINSTNLVNPSQKVVPQLKSLPFVNFFERPQVIMPDPLIIQKEQRIFPLP